MSEWPNPRHDRPMPDPELSQEGLEATRPTEILILTDDFLPLSVRESAKRAAIAVVESWRACKTYDEWKSIRDA